MSLTRPTIVRWGAIDVDGVSYEMQLDGDIPPPPVLVRQEQMVDVTIEFEMISLDDVSQNQCPVYQNENMCDSSTYKFGCERGRSRMRLCQSHGKRTPTPYPFDNTVTPVDERNAAQSPLHVVHMVRSFSI